MATSDMYIDTGDSYDRKSLPHIMFDPQTWTQTLKTVTGQAQYSRFCAIVLSYMRDGQSDEEEVERFVKLAGTATNDEFLRVPVRLITELQERG